MTFEVATSPTPIGMNGIFDRIRPWLFRVTAVLTGLVIPLLFIGRGAAAILVPVIGGFVVCLISRPEFLRQAAAWRRDPLAIAIIAMVMLWMLSVLGSIKPGFSFAIVMQAAGLLLLTAMLSRLLAKDAANFTWALRILVAMALVGGAIATISIFVWPPLLSYVRPVETPLSYHAALRLKAYAAVMPCLAPVVLWAGFRLGRWWRIPAIVAVILGALLVYGAHNRAAWSGYAGAIGFVAFAAGLRSLPAVWRIALIAIFAVLAALAGALVIANLPGMPFDGSQPPRLPTWLVDPHRQAIWGFVLDRALERPWLGWGPSTANFLPGADDTIPAVGQTFVPLHAHNWVLQFFSDVGVIGLTAAVVTIVLFLRGLLQRAFRGDAASWPAIALCGGFFISTLANFSIWQSWWQSVFVVLLSVTLAGSLISVRRKGADDLDRAKALPVSLGPERSAMPVESP